MYYKKKKFPIKEHMEILQKDVSQKKLRRMKIEVSFTCIFSILKGNAHFVKYVWNVDDMMDVVWKQMWH